jgi:very-short-patch-repair endonuclease
MGSEAVTTKAPDHPHLPSPLAGEGARRADEGFGSAGVETEGSSCVAGIVNPSSVAARHLLPQGEKGGEARRVPVPHHRSLDPFYLGAARRLRRAQTPQELKLWGILRDRRFAAHKFRRQVPIGRYIADFVCFGGRLIIELDGSQHAESVRDRVRDAWFEAEQFRVLRFWNNQVDFEPVSVADSIWHALEDPKP